MSQIIDALCEVMRHRLGELDRSILSTQDPRELRMLWRMRRRLENVCKALTGRKPANPGK